LLAKYDVAVEERGSNWIDLAADQRTLYYTSEGRKILRYDTATETQLETFATLPGEGDAHALRLLPPGDGSGGLLVADEEDIKRLDRNGQIIQRYDAIEHDSWFSLSLDPDSRSFWAADSETDMVYRFELATGSTLQRIEAGPGGTIFGLCVKGELTAGVPTNGGLPTEYSLSQNAPNPFNPSTQISYALPNPGKVELVIYNMIGQQIRSLVDGDRPAGYHRAVWDGRDEHGRGVASGVYFYRFASLGLVQTRRMLVLK
jgi:hypothetical protein